MEVRRILNDKPFFSICIPQHNRTSYLIEAIRSFDRQTFQDFEVCISDDFSTDGREEELLGFLHQSRLSFFYKKQKKNQGYDGNLRASIELARGRFCLLMGNDDCFASPSVLQNIHDQIHALGPAGVVITNYQDFSTHRVFQRMPHTGNRGGGYEVAIKNFRNFSFVSGVLFETAKALQFATDRWDGSEMYQMFIGCRIIAAGSNLLGLQETAVLQGIQIAGETVDSLASKPRIKPCPVIERKIPFNLVGSLVADAIQPYVNSRQRRAAISHIFSQIYAITYPFWIIEYRRLQSWNYSLGICLGMRPKNTLKGVSMGFFQRLYLMGLYGLVTGLGLMMPVRVFDKLAPILYICVKKIGKGGALCQKLN